MSYQQAREHRSAGRLPEALAAYLRVPDPPAPILVEAANVALHLDVSIAVRLASLALAKMPNLPAAQHTLGEARARQGRFAEAEALLRVAVARDGALAELKGGGAPWTRLQPEVACPACTAPAAEPVFVGNTSRAQRCFGHIDPVKVWVRCTACGLVRVSRPPSDDDLTAYYAALRGEGGDIRPPDARQLMHDILSAESILERIARHPLPNRRLLELGSAWGAFCAAAQVQDFDAVGLELAPAPVGFARDVLGVDVRQGGAPHDLPEGEFGVIALWEVIEHFRDPNTILRLLADRLAPRGILALSTPCLDHPVHRALGVADPMWLVPGHLVYYGKTTLRAALAQAGLTEIQRWSSNRHIGSVCVLACKQNVPAGTDAA